MNFDQLILEAKMGNEEATVNLLLRYISPVSSAAERMPL